ncbi:hypothetical protein SynMEDNS5_00489 [Synechococcus sp. MEDNS5]|uniref:hypothetical protein n=1 Tax=Synechococcus sp. MEDNS5 TaxID=1442554 RepID=UPI0016448F9A|nr:hypothetical protein [Synechococcus sp. MEDNS5]QNJ05233.1 hypothetical protein SynMEDNS5_00489 [Synechococcus sp. MEDNS5]
MKQPYKYPPFTGLHRGLGIREEDLRDSAAIPRRHRLPKRNEQTTKISQGYGPYKQS